MSQNPWTDREPEPGDFDAELATLDPRFAEVHEGEPQAKLRVVFSVDGEDAERLERIARARGEQPSQVVATLLREADRRGA